MDIHLANTDAEFSAQSFFCMDDREEALEIDTLRKLHRASKPTVLRASLACQFIGKRWTMRVSAFCPVVVTASCRA